MPLHKITQRECIESIADKYGLFWETIWNDPQNSDLREQRDDPDALLPGDIVFVPDKRRREEQGATEQKHRFRRKGVPSLLQIAVKHQGNPLANEPYVLKMEGQLLQGNTDAEGIITQKIPPGVKDGKLIVGQGEEQQEYDIFFGHLDPADTVSGVQERLSNLGFDCGSIDGVLGPKTKVTIRDFQFHYDLDQTGEINDETRSEIVKAYGR